MPSPLPCLANKLISIVARSRFAVYHLLVGMSLQLVSTVVALIASTISVTTVWLTLFRRGTIRMTQPSVVYLGPDAGRGAPPKVYFRALLFATAKRGRVLENLYLHVRCGDRTQNFMIWVHGDEPLVRGSGMFVPETGVVTNHHFLIAQRETYFPFRAGRYELEVFAAVVGCPANILLYKTSVELSYQAALSMLDQDAGVYFDWSADTRTYSEYVRKGAALSQGTASAQIAG